MHEAKQMTTGQPVGAASHTTVIPPPCESAASHYRVGLVRFESGRVLVFHGGVFGCSSRMNGKPSSPVLRGLGASNGARLLDPNRVTSECPSSVRNRRHAPNRRSNFSQPDFAGTLKNPPNTLA